MLKFFFLNEDSKNQPKSDSLFFNPSFYTLFSLFQYGCFCFGCVSTAFVFSSVFDTYKMPLCFIELSPSSFYWHIGRRGATCCVKEKKKMYAETGLMFPYFQTFPSEVQQFEDFCSSQEPNASMVVKTLFSICFCCLASFWFN